MKSKIFIILFVVSLGACNSGRGDTIVSSPTSTLSAVSTQDAIRVDLINKYPQLEQYNTFCNAINCYGVDVSSDGQWIYFTNFNTVDVFKTNGQKVGQYSFYDIYGYSIDYAEGYVEGVHWSIDGRYLYISANSGGDGGPEASFNYRSAMIRINLENGIWEDVNVSGSFKISPNDRFIVFSSDKSQIHIRNFSSEQEEIYLVPDDFHYFGKYVWSPDSKKVIFVGTSESWETQDSKFALFMIDLESDKIILLYEGLNPFYYPVEWAEDDKVSLNKYQKDGTWILDLSTNPPTIHP